MRAFTSLLILCYVALSSDLFAYLTPNEQGLFDMSDLVVIGAPVENKDGASSSLKATPHEIPIIEVQTRFEVLAVLKGSFTEEHIVLSHYRYAVEPNGTEARLIGPEPRAFSVDRAKRYLMFLTKRADEKIVGALAQDTFLSIQPLCEAP
jgi:hypothetical protein